MLGGSSSLKTGNIQNSTRGQRRIWKSLGSSPQEPAVADGKLLSLGILESILVKATPSLELWLEGMRLWWSMISICFHMFPYIWVNYNDLTATSLEIMVNKGNYPQKAARFRAVKYDNLPRYMHFYRYLGHDMLMKSWDSLVWQALLRKKHCRLKHPRHRSAAKDVNEQLPDQSTPGWLMIWGESLPIGAISLGISFVDQPYSGWSTNNQENQQ